MKHHSPLNAAKNKGPVLFQLSMAAIPRDRVATASQEAGPVTTVVVNGASRPYSGKQVGTAPALLFLTAALLLTLGYAGARSAQAVTFPAGVYSLSAADGQASSKVYGNPSVAGIAVRALWSTLEPAEGRFDWSYLDNEIQTATKAGKKVSISIAASSRGTPEWVYAAGAQPYRFVDQNPNHPTYGETLTMPLPWDSVYIERWTNFVSALGSRYANDTTISYVRGSAEIVTNGWGLPETDATGRSWSTYGYTPERLLAVMQTVVDALMDAFPRHAVWVEVGTIKFEPQISSHSQTYVAEQIAQYGFQTYPDRFGVWREDISGCIPNPPTQGHWKILWDHKGRSGAQMLWNVQDGPSRMNQCGITPNDKAAVLKAAIQTGLEYGMPYLEIYQADVLDTALTSVIQFAAENLGRPLAVFVNGDSSATVTVTNPVTVDYTIRGGAGQEFFMALDAPAMGIPWSHLNAAGQWAPLPANLGEVTPFATAPADGIYTLYTGTAPSGVYTLCLGYDTVSNGRLDQEVLVYDCIQATVR